MRTQGDTKEVLERVLANWHRTGSEQSRSMHIGGAVDRRTFWVAVVIGACVLALLATTGEGGLEVDRHRHAQACANVKAPVGADTQAGSRKGDDVRHAGMLALCTAQNYVREARQ